MHVLRPSVLFLTFVLLLSLPTGGTAQSLTPASNDERSAIDLEQDLGESLVSEIQSNPDKYGGVYYNSGGFVVLVLDDIPTAKPDVRITYVSVQHSYRELEAVRDAIVSEATLADPEVSGFLSVGIDVPSNSVILTVRDWNAPIVRPISQSDNIVQVAYGHDSLLPLACNSREDCLPLHGGTAIYAVTRETPQGYETECSTGGFARVSGGTVYLITAGHCDWYADANWYHYHTQAGTRLAGQGWNNGMWNGHDTDVLQLFPGATAYAPYNRIYYTNSSKNVSIAGTRSNSGLYSGLAVKKSGATTGTTTGAIVGDKYLGLLWSGGGPKYIWVYPTDMNAGTGDSGGPVWRWHPTIAGAAQIVGIVSSRNAANNTTFSSQEDAITALGLQRFCTESGCN